MVTGCKETPTSVGSGLLGSGDIPKLGIDTAEASIYSTVPTTISTVYSDRLLVGKYPEYTALTMIRFTGLPAGVFDTVSVTGARLQLQSVFHFGDASAPLAFLGYQLLANSDSASYDSLTTRSADYYNNSNPILAYPPTSLDDTSLIQCSLDTAIVHSWFTTDGSAANFGIILIPTNVSTIKSFGSFVNGTATSWPSLILYYTKNGITDTASFSVGVSRYVANRDLASLVFSDPQSMFVQSGVAYRAQLTFDLRNLPKPGLILKAQLELTYNPTVQPGLNPVSVDTLIAYRLNHDSTITDTPVPGVTVTSGNYKIYRFEIANYARVWANADSLQRLQFGGLRENSSLDLFPLYGTLSASAVRPRLIYTHVIQ